MLLTAFLFASLFIQSYLGHYRILTSLRGSPALIPIFIAPLGMVAALALATWLQPRAAAFYRVIMWAAVIVGMAGFFFHVRPHPPALAELWHLDFWLGSPPVAAPLGFVIAGLLGLAALWNLSWEPERVEQGLELGRLHPPSTDSAVGETTDLHTGGRP